MESWEKKMSRRWMRYDLASYSAGLSMAGAVAFDTVAGWWLLPAAVLGGAGYAIAHKDDKDFQGRAVDVLMHVPGLRGPVQQYVRREIATKLAAKQAEITQGYRERNTKASITSLPTDGMKPKAILENLLRRELTVAEIKRFAGLVERYRHGNPVINLKARYQEEIDRKAKAKAEAEAEAKAGSQAAKDVSDISLKAEADGQSVDGQATEGVTGIPLKAVSGALYPGEDPELFALMAFINEEFPYANSNQTSLWPEAQACEAETVGFVNELFKGDKLGVKGFMTPGGTGSILEIMLAYKRLALTNHFITRPNIVVPSTKHAAFTKAKELGIEVRVANCDPKTRKVNTAEVDRLVDRNTICVVGSAPNFPVGSVDDFKELSDIVERKSRYYGRSIGLHADICLGGTHTAFSDVKEYRDINFEDILGLTSATCDTHKTFYGPKESSVALMVTDMDHVRRHQKKPLSPQQELENVGNNLWAHGLYWDLLFEGGTYATAGLTRGSRTGVTGMQAWAAALYHGKSGYKKIAQAHQRQLKAFRDLIAKDEDLELVGTSDVCVMSVRAKNPSKVDIHRVGDELCYQGWKVHYTQGPSKGIHFCLTNAALSMQPDFAKSYYTAFKAAVGKYQKTPDEIPVGDSELYGALGKEIPPGDFVGNATQQAFVDLYMGGLWQVPEVPTTSAGTTSVRVATCN
jgi:sphinganine-1-phosphate aldolase